VRLEGERAYQELDAMDRLRIFQVGGFIFLFGGGLGGGVAWGGGG